MATGLEISKEFVDSTLLPLLKKEFSDDYGRLAVAIIGTGSDVLGLDDQISRDHHWGPRANIMFTREDSQRLRPEILSFLNNKLPDKFQDFQIHIDVGNLDFAPCFCVRQHGEAFVQIGDHYFLEAGNDGDLLITLLFDSMLPLVRYSCPLAWRPARSAPVA